MHGLKNLARLIKAKLVSSEMLNDSRKWKWKEKNSKKCELNTIQQVNNKIKQNFKEKKI